ncbi:MAG: Rnf-Nqr domain containing protein [Huintestinicola sp.]
MTSAGFDIQGFLTSLLTVLFTSAFAENMIFSRAIGTNTAMIAAKNKRNLGGVCTVITYMTTVSSLITGLLKGTLSETNEKYIPLIYTAVISAVYVITLILARIIFGAGFGRIKKYVHISAFNASVMGTMFLSMRSCSDMGEFIMFGFGSGVGFTVGAYMLSAVRQQLYSEKTPAVFRGYPAVMIFVGIIAMAFYGVLGHAPSYI